MIYRVFPKITRCAQNVYFKVFANLQFKRVVKKIDYVKEISVKICTVVVAVGRTEDGYLHFYGKQYELIYS